MADQGLTAAAGFAINVALARWLEPAAYGSFALGFAIVLIVSMVHNALVLEPMSVLGPSRHAEALDAYLAAQRCLHWRLTIPPAAGLCAAGIGLSLAGAPGALSQGIAGAGIALPLVLRFWLARRIFYVVGHPSSALRSSAVFLAATAFGIATLASSGRSSPLAGFVILAASGALASAAAGWRRDGAAEIPPWRDVLREQWRYGRWMVAADGISFGGSQVQIFVAAGIVGLGAAGGLRAVQIAMLPMVQLLTAVATLALPVIARDFGRGDVRAMRRKAAGVTASAASVALLYEVVLVLFHPEIERFLFGGKFAGESWLIPVLGAVPVINACTIGLSLLLRAAQRPAHYLVAAAVGGPAGLALAVGFTAAWGVPGAAAGLVATAVVTLAVYVVLVSAWGPRRPA